jgi:hypothetical protein
MTESCNHAHGTERQGSPTMGAPPSTPFAPFLPTVKSAAISNRRCWRWQRQVLAIRRGFFCVLEPTLNLLPTSSVFVGTKILLPCYFCWKQCTNLLASSWIIAGTNQNFAAIFLLEPFYTTFATTVFWVSLLPAPSFVTCIFYEVADNHDYVFFCCNHCRFFFFLKMRINPASAKA